MFVQPPKYIPTPREIRDACESIQLGWSDDERRRRRYGMMPGRNHASGGDAVPPGWSPPTLPTPDGWILPAAV